MPLVIYGLEGGLTYTDTWRQESDLKTPGMHWPQAGMRLV